MDLGTDGVVMKNKSLFFKSMFWIIIPAVLIAGTIFSFTKKSIGDYFKRESYSALEREWELFNKSNLLINLAKIQPVKNPNNPPANQPAPRQNVINVGGILPDFAKPEKSARSTIIVEAQDGNYRVQREAEKFIVLELQDLDSNDRWPYQGETLLEGDKVFFSITPIEEGEYLERLKVRYPAAKAVYHLAYISEDYSDSLTSRVMKVFTMGVLVLLVTILLVLFIIFRNISIRLKHLEKGSQSIGNGNFKTTIDEQPFDEIGRLGTAMNKMGRQLSLIQEEQAENFQVISHELKTPIMVMQGYVDAMSQGLYPTGSKEDSIRIITEELTKLESMTKNIITLNKVDYLSKNKVKMDQLILEDMFEEVGHNLNVDHKIKIEVRGSKKMTGDKDSWYRIIENVMSNQLRYAQNKISVDLDESMRISNDGPNIDENLLGKITNPFVKGKDGKSGLGLTIINNTLRLYGYGLEVTNKDVGVEYHIYLK